MRALFQFTLRDLFWLTFVVSLGVGWWVHDWQRRTELDDSSAQTQVWRLRAGALESQLGCDGWKVSWSDTSETRMEKIRKSDVVYNPSSVVVYPEGFEPSNGEP